MITNIPTADDFAKHGITFLNFAWDAVFDLLLDYSEGEDWDAIVDNEQSEGYWQAAKKPLSIAHALAQQGAELILKAKITRESPYLLIVGHPKEWPKLCDKEHTAFADFRTVDAQDLIRVYNTVCVDQLSEQFVTTFEKFRKQRNALFHTVDNRLDFSEEEIVTYILNIAHLIDPKKWPMLRKEYLEEQPVSQLYGTDAVMNRLCREMKHMVDLIGRAELLSLFGFNKKQRRYICPRCYWECSHHIDVEYPRTAQLQPNTSRSTTLHCFVCGNDIAVVREACLNGACKGNVINAEDNHECLTCFE